MKKIVNLIAGCTLIVCVCVLIYSCNKNMSLSQSESSVPNALLEAAKTWHSQQTGSSNKSLSINVSATTSNVLTPNWKASSLQMLSNGNSKLIVPSPHFDLDPKSTMGSIRKFVFTVKKGAITHGKILEIYADAKYILEHQDLVEKYNDGKLGDFTGVVLTYDVNYRYANSDVFEKGTKLRKTSALTYRQSGQPDETKRVSGPSAIGVFPYNPCYNVWLTEYEPDGTFIDAKYLYSYCTGSDSYYDNAEANGGGVGAGYQNCPPADAVAFEMASEGVSESIEMSSDSTYSSNDATVHHTWKIWETNAGANYETSTETITKYYDGSSWNITGINHNSADFHGSAPSSGILTVAIDYVNPSYSGFYATMNLIFSINTSFTCSGVPSPTIIGDEISVTHTWN